MRARGRAALEGALVSMQNTPRNKMAGGASSPGLTRVVGQERSPDYAAKCRCRAIVTVPASGETVRCPQCGHRFVWGAGSGERPVRQRLLTDVSIPDRGD